MVMLPRLSYLRLSFCEKLLLADPIAELVVFGLPWSMKVKTHLPYLVFPAEGGSVR